jgi:hypothetical protein
MLNQPTPRLATRIAPLLLVLLFVPISGCLFCNHPKREAGWKQEGLPPLDPLRGVDYRFQEFWGNFRHDDPTDYYSLVVYSNHTVSHENLVQFANSLFSSQGWPPPQLENAREVTSCGDSW